MKYFKMIYKGTAVGLFNSSDEKLISATKEAYKKARSEVVEITEEEYKRLEKQLGKR